MRRVLRQAIVGLVVFGWGAALGARAQAAANGQAVFATKGCAHCHGDQAQGTDRGPDLRDKRPRLSSKHIREQILQGGNGMPAFGDLLSDAEVKQLVAYLRSLKPVKGGEAAAPQPTATPAASSPEER